MAAPSEAYKEMEWDGHLVMKLLKHVSLEKCYGYLVNGYLKRNCRKQVYEAYPLELQQLKINYLGSPTNFFYRFNSSLSDTSKTKMINENFITAKSEQHGDSWILATVLMDLPIPVNDKNMNLKWSLKIHAPGLENGHYFIGIVHDKYKAFDTTVWSNTYRSFALQFKKGDGIDPPFGIYGLCGNPLINDDKMSVSTVIWNGLRGPMDRSQHDLNCEIGKENYVNDDIVVCEYDGKLNRFIIRKKESDQLICNFKLAPTDHRVKYWYPAISLRDSGDYVEIVQ